MKKNILYIILVGLGISLMYIIFLRYYPDVKNAPKLFFKHELYLDVKEISFERNHLYLNDTLYDAGGISGYSRVYSSPINGTDLMSIMPPFRMEKSANNDTLRIIKENKRYYLVVTKEQNYVKNNCNGGVVFTLLEANK